VLKAADGTKFDTRLASGVITGPYITPILIPVGKSRANLGEDVRIRWAGPLSVTPMCLGTPLPALRTDVGAPEPAPTDAAALTSVIGATGGFLDHCQPKQAGVPVQGLIFPPSGSTPPMQAQCSIKLEDQGAFLVAQLRVITPTELQGLRISEPYERITMPNQGGNSEVVVWGFVVTERGATPVYATTESQTKRANGVVTSWQWDGSSWVTGGSSRCGGSELSGGGWQGYVSFVSACAP
jgi:hypothetical protein